MYCTEANLSARYGATEVTQLQTDGRDISAAITAADALIDSYLTSGGYTVPLDPVPGSIQHASEVIARYNLWEDAASEEVRDRYKDVIAWLRDVAKGNAALGDPDADAEVPPASTLKVSSGSSNFDWCDY